MGALRQVEGGSEGVPATTERDLVLFEPATAYRSANGVVISWWVGEGVESAVDAKLEVIDATGEVVRTFEPAEEGEERDRWNGPALPVGTGLQRVAVGERHRSRLPQDRPDATFFRPHDRLPHHFSTL